VKKAGMIPTPKAQSSRAACEHGDGGPDLQTTVGKAPGLKLQPAFVEWMMGYPLGFTDVGSKDLKPLETPSSPRSHMRSSDVSQK